MRREGELLAALDHPGLSRTLHLDLEGERPYIEMEHVDGRRLSTLVRRRGRADAQTAARIGRGLAATLHYVHTEGVLHLDVKPSNVIVGRAARLIDFSVARRIGRARRISGFVGTDAFMAPEQADPSLWATIGPKTDVWGLGATLYYALAARRPHARGDRHAAGAVRFPQLVESPAPLDPTLHAASLAQLIMQSLARSPEDRPSMRELCGRFDDLATNARAGPSICSSSING